MHNEQTEDQPLIEGTKVDVVDEVARDMMRQFLDALEVQTEVVLEQYQIDARENESLAGEAVNYADLHCVSTETYLNNNGDAGYRVYIEEADPSCQKLRAYVADGLRNLGFVDIEVITEW